MNQPQEIVIEPDRSWVHFRLKELFQYRDLLLFLIYRDFIAKYKQTILGPFWFVVQPVLTAIVFTVIFGHIAEVSTDGAPRMLFNLCGLLGWNYFSMTLGGNSTIFLSNQHLFDKVYFPRLIVPLSSAGLNLIALALNFIIFAGFYIYFEFFTAASATISVQWNLLWTLPLFILMAMALALGAGFWLSSLTAKYRDLVHLVSFLSQLWMYGSPIIYPLSDVPESWRAVAALNPMVSVCEGFKMILLGNGSLTLPLIGISSVVTLVMFLTGLLFFQRTERKAVDTA